MNDIRRTILWVIFGFSMVLLWDQWQVFNGQKATFFPSPVAPANQVARTATPANPVPSSNTALTSSAASAPVPSVANATAAPAVRERITLTSDLLKLVFDSEGGTLIHSEMLQHTGGPENKEGRFVLFDQSASRVYLAHTGLIGAVGQPVTELPTHKTVMTAVPAERTLVDGKDTLSVRFESPEINGVKLVKTYTLQRGSYAVAVKHEVTNSGAVAVQPRLYFQLVRDGNKPAGESSFYSTFTGPAVYTEAKKYQKIEFSEIEKDKAEYEKTSANGYVAMVQHYFVSAWLLPAGVPRELFAKKNDTNLYSVGMITALPAIASNTTATLDAQLFVGPQEEKKMEALYPGLELVKDYGFLTILSKPLYWLLDKLHGYIQNWGWSIVALVLLLKIAFYWLNAKAYSSMAKMKAINPKIMEMRERLKDKPQEMQQEMMKIYREEKVNPMGGCFPIMVQIPVFIALYWVLLSTVEMRNAPWTLWIHDLAAPDPYFILPIVMTLTTMLQTALNPAPPDPMQAKMMWFMPLIFSVMFFFFPAGLVLYWITNNVLSIAQQWLINTRMGVPPQFNLPKF